MSYENEKLMNLEDGQLLLSVLDKRKADIISVSDTTPAAVKTLTDGADGMPMGLTVGIEPVQDLHGQSNPYPAGAGKNKLNPDEIVQGSFANPSTTSRCSTRNDTSIPIAVGDKITVSRQSSSIKYAVGVFDMTTGDSLQDSGWQSGSSYVFTATAEGYVRLGFAQSDLSSTLTPTEVKSAQFQIESGSTATDYAPYSNICPITGWTGAEVTRTGRNFWVKTACSWSRTNSSGWSTVADNSDDRIRSTPAVDCGMLKGQTVTFSGIPSAYSFLSVRYFDKDKTSIKTESTVTHTVPNNAEYVFIQLGGSNLSADDKTVLANADIQLEIGSTASAYEPYQGETYQIAFPSEAGTVYGGTLAVNKDGSGSLYVNRVLLTYDGSNDEDWAESSTAGVYYYKYALAPSTVNQASNIMPLANKYKWSANIRRNASDLAVGEISYATSAGNRQLNINANIQTLEAFVASLAETPLQIVCTKYNPQTYDLSASEVNAIITSLKGVNNLYADSGDVLAVDYSADTKLYVDGKISEGMKLIALLLTANHENGMKASKAYASGDLLTVGNTLYKATTSIANGATLTAGTNVTETTIAQELAALA